MLRIGNLISPTLSSRRLQGAMYLLSLFSFFIEESPSFVFTIECMHYYVTQNLPSIRFWSNYFRKPQEGIFHRMTQLTNAYESPPRNRTSDHVLSLSSNMAVDSNVIPFWLIEWIQSIGGTALIPCLVSLSRVWFCKKCTEKIYMISPTLSSPRLLGAMYFKTETMPRQLFESAGSCM